MFMCFAKVSSVINLIHSGQELCSSCCMPNFACLMGGLTMLTCAYGGVLNKHQLFDFLARRGWGYLVSIS